VFYGEFGYFTDKNEKNQNRFFSHLCQKLNAVSPDLATSSEFGSFSYKILTEILLWLLSFLATFLAYFENVKILPLKALKRKNLISF
jgi:hypothetical protein